MKPKAPTSPEWLLSTPSLKRHMNKTKRDHTKHNALEPTFSISTQKFKNRTAFCLCYWPDPWNKGMRRAPRTLRKERWEWRPRLTFQVFCSLWDSGQVTRISVSTLVRWNHSLLRSIHSRQAHRLTTLPCTTFLFSVQRQEGFYSFLTHLQVSKTAPLPWNNLSPVLAQLPLMLYLDLKYLPLGSSPSTPEQCRSL